MLDEITPVILTRDEEANLARALAQLAWAGEVIVVDSCSTDRTQEIARSFPNVRLLERPFDSLAGQSNFGLSEVRTAWAMLLDADYFVPDAFADELRSLSPAGSVAAYVAPFVYAVGGRPLRASLYPPRIVLLRSGRAHVWQDGHAHRVEADGTVLRLSTAIVHDDRKSWRRFLERQRVYMRQEAAKLRGASFRDVPLSGKLRKLRIAPLLVPLHTLLARRLILDGIPGLKYAWERTVAEWILFRELMRR